MTKYRQDLDTFREMFASFKNSSDKKLTILNKYEQKFESNKGKEIFQEFRKEFTGFFTLPGGQEKAAIKAIDKLYFNASILTHLPEVREQFAKSEASALIQGLIHPEIAAKEGLLEKFDRLTEDNKKLVKSNEELKDKLTTVEKKLEEMKGFYKNLSENVIIRFKLSPEEVQKMAKTKVVLQEAAKTQAKKTEKKNGLSF